MSEFNEISLHRCEIVYSTQEFNSVILGYADFLISLYRNYNGYTGNEDIPVLSKKIKEGFLITTQCNIVSVANSEGETFPNTTVQITKDDDRVLVSVYTHSNCPVGVIKNTATLLEAKIKQYKGAVIE